MVLSATATPRPTACPALSKLIFHVQSFLLKIVLYHLEMGGKCPHRKVKKRRLSHKTARRGKFLLKADDAVYEELVKLADHGKDLPVDDDLPGMGQFYCLHCDRYFSSESVKDEHYRSKRHKKRVKVMSGPAPHTQLDAELAAGMGMPDNGLKLMSM